MFQPLKFNILVVSKNQYPDQYFFNKCYWVRYQILIISIFSIQSISIKILIQVLILINTRCSGKLGRHIDNLIFLNPAMRERGVWEEHQSVQIVGSKEGELDSNSWKTPQAGDPPSSSILPGQRFRDLGGSTYSGFSLWSKSDVGPRARCIGSGARDNRGRATQSFDKGMDQEKTRSWRRSNRHSIQADDPPVPAAEENQSADERFHQQAPLRSDGATSSFIGYPRGSVAARGVAAMHAAWSRTRALCLQICSMRRELHLRAH